MRFIIYGAGAIGSVMGGYLFNAGYKTVLIGNKAHTEEIGKNGLRLLSPDGDLTLKLPAFSSANELSFTGEDVIMLCAKSHQTYTCLGQLKKARAPKSMPIFCCQNSIANELFASRVFENIYGVVINYPGIFLKSGEVVNPIVENHGFIEVGCFPSGIDKTAKAVMKALEKAGFAGGVNENVLRAKGAKCLGNLNNAVSAVVSDRGGTASKKIGEKLREEATRCWEAAGIEWEPYDHYQKRVSSLRGSNVMPESYAHLHPRGSSWQSLERRTGNIESIILNGDVVLLGNLLNIPTPYNEVVMDVAMKMAANREKPGKLTAERLLELIREGGGEA